MNDITDEVKKLVDTINGSGKIISLKQVKFPDERRDYCAFAMSIEKRVSSHEYSGLDYVYVGWRGHSGELEHRLLASSNHPEDFLDVLAIYEKGTYIVVKYEGGDYGGDHRVVEIKFPKGEFHLT